MVALSNRRRLVELVTPVLVGRPSADPRGALSLHPRSLDRAVRIAALPALVVAWLIAGAAPVGAECDGPIPSFRAVAATAKRVVIGEVVAVHPSELTAEGADGRSSRFTLRVTDVPRGRAPKTMEIDDLPTQPCASIVVARVGDRLAIAFDAIDFEPPVRVNTAAWIRGVPPGTEFDLLTAFESTTRAEVYALLGIEPPDTSIGPVTDKAPGGSPWWPLVVAAVAGGIAGWLGGSPRWRRRGPDVSPESVARSGQRPGG